QPCPAVPRRRRSPSTNGSSGTVSSSSRNPTRTAVPPGLVSSHVGLTAPRTPEHSNTTSPPRPPVNSATAAAATSGAQLVAPNDSASARRSGTGSTARTPTVPAPRATWATSRPITPAPTTTTVWPTRSPALLTALAATETGSANAATSVGTWSGIVTQVRPLATKYSASPPSACRPDAASRGHSVSWCRRHHQQLPQPNIVSG